MNYAVNLNNAADDKKAQDYNKIAVLTVIILHEEIDELISAVFDISSFFCQS